VEVFETVITITVMRYRVVTVHAML